MSLIPKIIHQTHPTRDLPAPVVDNVRRLRLGNPEWRYQFYDDQEVRDFIRRNYDARIQKAYERINPRYGATKADFFRYLLMYRIGGVYLDIKSGANRPLNQIVAHHQYLLSHWDNDEGGTHPNWGKHFTNFPNGEFQQWYIAAVPGHPFLRSVIEMALNNIENYTVERFGVGFEGAMSMTGPIPYTLAITPLLQQASHHLLRTNHEHGLLFNALSVEYRQLLYSQKRPHYSWIDEPMVIEPAAAEEAKPE